MTTGLPTRRWTVEEYHRMADAGVLGEDDRVELLEGEVVEMAPIGSRHNACVDRLVAILQPQVTGRAILRVQGSIRLSQRTEPQPDIALLRWRDDFYADELPGPAHVLFVVEVAEASADTDRDKAMTYGRAGVSQTCLVDLCNDQVEECRDPTADGYAYSRTHRPGDEILVAALPQVEIAVAAILA